MSRLFFEWLLPLFSTSLSLLLFEWMFIWPFVSSLFLLLLRWLLVWSFVSLSLSLFEWLLLLLSTSSPLFFSNDFFLGFQNHYIFYFSNVWLFCDLLIHCVFSFLMTSSLLVFSTSLSLLLFGLILVFLSTSFTAKINGVER